MLVDLLVQVQSTHVAFGVVLGYVGVGFAGHEADDLVFTIQEMALARGITTTVASGDKDLPQMVDDSQSVSMLLARNGDRWEHCNNALFVEKFGVQPSQYYEYKALIGASSDGYKVVPGVGAKTAAKLLTEFGSLAGIQANLAELSMKLAAKFTALMLDLRTDFLLPCKLIA